MAYNLRFPQVLLQVLRETTFVLVGYPQSLLRVSNFEILATVTALCAPPDSSCQS